MVYDPPPYPFLIRRAGRGRTVAHLADARGEAVCGLALGERWEPARTTERRVCGRRRAVVRHNGTQRYATPD